ncbi:hypothetical protein IC582_028497 [Cucumis melo]
MMTGLMTFDWELGFPWECILVVLMGIERGMIYSSPVTCEKGEWSSRDMKDKKKEVKICYKSLQC